MPRLYRRWAVIFPPLSVWRRAEKDRLNAMYMVDGYGENNPIVEKSQFVMSLVEQIDKNGVGPQRNPSLTAAPRWYIRRRSRKAQLRLCAICG